MTTCACLGTLVALGWADLKTGSPSLVDRLRALERELTGRAVAELAHSARPPPTALYARPDVAARWPVASRAAHRSCWEPRLWGLLARYAGAPARLTSSDACVTGGEACVTSSNACATPEAVRLAAALAANSRCDKHTSEYRELYTRLTVLGLTGLAHLCVGAFRGPDGTIDEAARDQHVFQWLGAHGDGDAVRVMRRASAAAVLIAFRAACLHSNLSVLQALHDLRPDVVRDPVLRAGEWARAHDRRWLAVEDWLAETPPLSDALAMFVAGTLDAETEQTIRRAAPGLIDWRFPEVAPVRQPYATVPYAGVPIPRTGRRKNPKHRCRCEARRPKRCKSPPRRRH